MLALAREEGFELSDSELEAIGGGYGDEDGWCSTNSKCRLL